jgi:AraC-like DNA-binding protein
MIHRGEIVEKIVRRSGYSLIKLSSHLAISRNTLYNRFRSADLSWHFISEVGKFIHHDFTLEFPELKEEPGLIDQNAICRTEGKYVRLLEKYNQLLGIVIRIANEYRLHKVHQEIVQLVDTAKEEKG